MPLTYGFHFGPNMDESEGEKKPCPIYSQLSEYDQNFFHQVLPWILMGVGVRFVTEATIPIIVERWPIMSVDSYNETLMFQRCHFGDKMPPLQEYLKRFIGFETNVTFDTTAKFLKRMRLTKVTDKSINDMWREFGKLRQQLHQQSMAGV